MRDLLTIAIVTFDDYRGLSLTVQSLGLHQTRKNFRILVFDNYGKCEKTTEFCKSNGIDRHVTDVSKQGTCYAKSQAIEHCLSQYVLVIDSHVLLSAGAVDQLLVYLQASPAGNKDILHGILYNAKGEISHTEMTSEWSGGMMGKWHNRFAKTAVTDQPFEIFGHGGALFCVDRVNWPGYHPDTKGFGGEEGIIQEIYRDRGGKALCLPFIKWTHSFNSSKTISHVVKSSDKFTNYLLNISKLRKPNELWTQCILHFTNYLNMTDIREICSKVLPANYHFDHSIALRVT